MTKLISESLTANFPQPIGHHLFIRNETSNTHFTKADQIETKELKNNGIVIELPINVCQQGHNLTLFFLPLELKNVEKIKIPRAGAHIKEAVFEAVAKIEKLVLIEHDDPSESRVWIDITFSQYDLNKWESILSIYTENQKGINNILMKQHQVHLD